MAKVKTAPRPGRLAFGSHGAANSEPRKRPKQARSQQTVDALLEATARVLAARGFEGATTNEIARVAGVSVGSLYQYFPSKEALVAALLEQRTRADIDHIFSVAAPPAGSSIEDQLRLGTSAAIEVYRKDLPLYRALLQNVSRIGRAEVMSENAQRGREGLKAMIEASRGRVRDVDPELGAFILSSAIEWVILSAILEHPERLEDPRLVDEIVTLALGYLMTPAT